VRRVRAPETIFWGAFSTQVLLIAIVFSRGLRGCRMDSGYHQGIIFVIATFAGPMLIPILYRPHEGMDLTAYRCRSIRSLHSFTALWLSYRAGYWGGYYLFWYWPRLLAW